MKQKKVLLTPLQVKQFEKIFKDLRVLKEIKKEVLIWNKKFNK